MKLATFKSVALAALSVAVDDESHDYFAEYLRQSGADPSVDLDEYLNSWLPSEDENRKAEIVAEIADGWTFEIWQGVYYPSPEDYEGEARNYMQPSETLKGAIVDVYNEIVARRAEEA